MTEDIDSRRVSLRAVNRRGFLRGTLAVSAGGALLAAGCGSGGGSAKTPTAGAASTASAGSSPEAATPDATAKASGITPFLLTQEFVALQDSRFAVGLIDKGGKFVNGAAVHLRFFSIGGADASTGVLKGEGDAAFRELKIAGAHAHDSSAQGVTADEGVSFYVADTQFSNAGKWGVEVSARLADGSPSATIQAPFNVLQKPFSPGTGTVPPASKNDTFATNSNTESLCSRTPACPLHDKVIGDLLGKGRPLVVIFSTPAFCTSRFCGPVLEVLLDKAPAYQDRVDFVHIEVWQDFQLQKHRTAADEWNLPTEPYTFFMDKTGKILAKIEAIFTGDELVSVLDALVKA